MRKIIKNKNLVPVTIADLNLDDSPDLNSTDPVTSRGIATAITEAVGTASDALQEQIDDIAEKAGSGYTPKGEASVATLNGLTGQENGWLYTMTDAGTLTDGSVAVVAGEQVAWDEANSVWYKAMDYAPSQYGTNEVHNLPTSITAFRTGDVIPVDGPSGTAKMGKDDLLRETAENAVSGNVAPAFDPTRTSGNSYEFGELVTRNGKVYIFINEHYGAWSSSDVREFVVGEITAMSSNSFIRINDVAATDIYHHKVIPVNCGASYTVYFDTTDWVANNWTSPYDTLCKISAINKNGTSREIFKRNVNQGIATIPSDYSFKLNADEFLLVIDYRADSSSVVRMKAYNTSIKTLEEYIVSHGVAPSISSFTFDGKDTAILEKFIDVSQSANYSVYMDKSDWTANNYTNVSQTLFAIYAVDRSGTQRELFKRNVLQGIASVPDEINVSTNDGEFKLRIVARADVGKSVSFDICADTSKDVVKNSADIADVNNSLNLALGKNNFTIDGNGIAFVYSKKFPVLRGTEYVITRNKTSWNCTAVTSNSSSILSYIATLDDGTELVLANWAKRSASSIGATYNIHIPDDAKTLHVRMRADVGESVTFTLTSNSGISYNEGWLFGDSFLTKMREFTDKFNGAGEDACSFLFFTDPHWLQPDVADWGNVKWESRFLWQINNIERWASMSPIDFVLNGGDWLTQDCTQSDALLRLGSAFGYLRHNLPEMVNLVGNHDTNYQGVISAEDPSAGTFADGVLGALIYGNNGGKCYGKKSFGKTSVFFFDSGLDHNSSMDAYRWEQVAFFANELLSEDNPHSIIAVHIIKNSGSVQPFADNLTKVAEACNDRTFITMNGKTYDFSNSSTKVEFAIGGHVHADEDFVSNSIRCVLTINASGTTGTTSFDVCLADYDSRKLYCIRHGDGSSREISF